MHFTTSLKKLIDQKKKNDFLKLQHENHAYFIIWVCIYLVFQVSTLLLTVITFYPLIYGGKLLFYGMLKGV